MKDFDFKATDFIYEHDLSTPFSEGRYPYTYACDFIRGSYNNICEVLGLEPGEYPLSRAEASGFMKKLNDGDSNYRHIALVFADAYCLREHIAVPKILGFQVNLVGTDLAVGHIFPTHESAVTWAQKNPPKTSYFSIDTIFEK